MADTVRVVVAATDDSGVAEVTLLVDAATAATRFSSPWTLAWVTDPLPDSTFHQLQAVACDLAGNRAMSAAHTVLVRRNTPPQVTLLHPPDRLWIPTAGGAGQPWRCRASDPEEGMLGDSCLTWFLDGTALPARAASIPSPQPAIGMHRIAVEARDRWGARARDERTVTVFEYPGNGGAPQALETYLCALRARDPERAAACLSGEFLQLAPGESAALGGQDRRQAVAALQALLTDSTLSVLAIDAYLEEPEYFTHGTREWAKIEICALSVALVAERAAGEFVRCGVIHSQARVFLQIAGGVTDPLWQIHTWWDTHRATWSQAQGTSWSTLLAECGPGSWCPDP